MSSAERGDFEAVENSEVFRCGREAPCDGVVRAFVCMYLCIRDDYAEVCSLNCSNFCWFYVVCREVEYAGILSMYIIFLM